MKKGSFALLKTYLSDNDIMQFTSIINIEVFSLILAPVF